MYASMRRRRRPVTLTSGWTDTTVTTAPPLSPPTAPRLPARGGVGAPLVPPPAPPTRQSSLTPSATPVAQRTGARYAPCPPQCYDYDSRVSPCYQSDNKSSSGGNDGGSDCGVNDGSFGRGDSRVGSRVGSSGGNNPSGQDSSRGKGSNNSCPEVYCNVDTLHSKTNGVNPSKPDLDIPLKPAKLSIPSSPVTPATSSTPASSAIPDTTTGSTAASLLSSTSGNSLTISGSSPSTSGSSISTSGSYISPSGSSVCTDCYHGSPIRACSPDLTRNSSFIDNKGFGNGEDDEDGRLVDGRLVDGRLVDGRLVDGRANPTSTSQRNVLNGHTAQVPVDRRHAVQRSQHSIGLATPTVASDTPTVVTAKHTIASDTHTDVLATPTAMKLRPKLPPKPKLHRRSSPPCMSQIQNNGQVLSTGNDSLSVGNRIPTSGKNAPSAVNHAPSSAPGKLESKTKSQSVASTKHGLRSRARNHASTASGEHLNVVHPSNATAHTTPPCPPTDHHKTKRNSTETATKRKDPLETPPLKPRPHTSNNKTTITTTTTPTKSIPTTSTTTTPTTATTTTKSINSSTLLTTSSGRLTSDRITFGRGTTIANGTHCLNTESSERSTGSAGYPTPPPRTKSIKSNGGGVEKEATLTTCVRAAKLPEVPRVEAKVLREVLENEHHLPDEADSGSYSSYDADNVTQTTMKVSANQMALKSHSSRHGVILETHRTGLLLYIYIYIYIFIYIYILCTFNLSFNIIQFLCLLPFVLWPICISTARTDINGTVAIHDGSATIDQMNSSSSPGYAVTGNSRTGVCNTAMSTRRPSRCEVVEWSVQTVARWSADVLNMPALSASVIGYAYR